MNAKAIFRLIVRILGLVFLTLAVRNIVGLLYAHGFAILYAILAAVIYLLVGWWLVGGARLLVDRAYPGAEETPEPKRTSAPTESFGREKSG